jgi:hypothetical protein
MSTSVAVITAFIAVLRRSFFESCEVMVRNTGMIPKGFINVRKEVK